MKFFVHCLLVLNDRVQAQDLNLYAQCSAHFETTNNAIVEECAGQAK